jgi:glucose/arabinose dehydrogenase
LKRLWIACLLIVLLASCGQKPSKNTTNKELIPIGMGNDGVPAKLVGEGPPCVFTYWVPYYNVNLFCFEVVYDNVTPPEAVPALTGLAFGSDGTLYMARTAFGEIWAMPDADGDQVLDDPVLVAEGLGHPTGITVYKNALYVLTVEQVLRLSDTDGDGYFQQQTVLVDNLPTGGFWPGSIGIGPDGRLYISLGASCTTCEDVQPGTLRSYNLRGGREQIEATGLRNPADFAWDSTGRLWIVDSGPSGENHAPDELNRVRQGGDYGFPYCYGKKIPTDTAPEGDYCAGTAAPVVTFPYQSHPSGLAFYSGDTFPFWRDRALVVLSGSWDTPEPAGYALTVTQIGELYGTRVLIPSSQPPYPANSVAEYSLTRRGFFPYHPVDVVVSREGWIYVSVAEGRIFRIRSRPPRPEAES